MSTKTISQMTPAERESAGVYVTGWDADARNYYFEFAGPDAAERLAAWRSRYPNQRTYKERGEKATGTPGTDGFNIRLYYSPVNNFYTLSDKIADDNHFHKSKF